MWLDRLAGGPANTSGSSTPQPASRPYSPLPRRTSSSLSPYVTSQRAGHSPRASSLSLVSNDSTTSLLSSSRRANGSNPRLNSTAEEVPKPAEILGKIFPVVPEGQQSLIVSEDDLAFDPDFGGLTLKELVDSDTAQDELAAALQPRSQAGEECWYIRLGCSNV
jgi:vacuolar protein sorting-associated protein 52